MAIVHSITLRDVSDWRNLVDLVRQHAGPMAAKGTPLRVLVAIKRSARSKGRNAWMWADVLEQIEEQAVVNGRRWSAEAWHDEMKRRHLPDVCAKGVEKWRFHADGSRELVMSTSDLDDDEFDAYLMAVQADAATRYGVVFMDREAVEAD